MELEPPVAAAVRVGLGMEVHQAVDGKYLRLPARTLFGWLQLEHLELRIPNSQKLAAQESGAPAKNYQRIRTDVVSAQLQMHQVDVDAWTAQSGPMLTHMGVDELELRCSDNHIELVARIRESGEVADLSARLYLTSQDDEIRVSCGHARIYGYLGTPAPLVAHRLLSAILHTEAQHQVTSVLGLTDFDLRPLHSALYHCLPAAGWRLPSQSDLAISVIAVTTEGITLRFRGTPERRHHPADSRTAVSASLADSLERYRSGDTLLLNGQVEDALNEYRGHLPARGPQPPFLVERILSIVCSAPEYFKEGQEFARQVLGQWPDFAPAHAAIASIAIAEGDMESAASRYRELSQGSTALGDEEGSVRAAIASARLLRHFAPDASTKLYEFVLESRPSHAESAEALSERYHDEERWSDLVRLIRTRLANADDTQQRARDHARLAQILVERLESPELALAELIAACRLDESIASIYEQKAEVEFGLESFDDALASLESANRLHASKHKLRQQTQNLLRGGKAAIATKKFEVAESWFHAALELSPGNSPALQGAAQAATGLGQHTRAARLWRELFDAGLESPMVQAHFACQLGWALLLDNSFTEARSALQHATKTGAPATRAEAHAALAQMSQSDAHTPQALEHLKIAIDELDCSDPTQQEQTSSPLETAERRRRGAELSLERAQLALSEDLNEEAMFDLRRAFDYAPPSHSIRKDAARILLEHTGSNEGELPWIDELAENNSDREECVYLALRRASILAAAQDVDAALAVVTATLEEESISDAPRRSALQLKANLLAMQGKSSARADVLAQRAALSGSNVQRAAASVESAQGWLDAGDSERCLAALRIALQRLSDADSEMARTLRTSALRLLGQCSWRARSWQGVEEAQRLLHADALEQAPAEDLFRWGTALEHLGQPEQAIAVLEQLTGQEQAAPMAAQAALLLGHLYEQLGQFVKAAGAQEAYAANDAEQLSNAAHSDAWYRAGALYRCEASAISDAKRCLDKALSIANDHLPALDALEQLSRQENDHERLAVILGRKVAAMGRHPKRQRGLLVRLAELHEHVLGRPDVARETYRRILQMEPEYRPALRFAARAAIQSGNLSFACDALQKLTGTLPCDGELSLGDEQLREQRTDALFSLASVVESTAGEAGPEIQALLLSQARELDDDRLWRSLETICRRERNLVGLADVLGRRRTYLNGDKCLRIDLERIDILFNQLGDFGGALIALRIAQESYPGNEKLAAWQSRLETYKPVPPTKQAKKVASEEDVLAEAQALLDKGDWSNASEVLSPYDSLQASTSSLWLHVEAALGLGDLSKALVLLPVLVTQAQEFNDVDAEYRAVRRQADLLIESQGDNPAARTLYKRALQLNPDDLVAAEIYAELVDSSGDVDEVQSAREDVLRIARQTDAGPQQEALALVPLAEQALRADDISLAIEHYEQAIALAPSMLDLYRKCAHAAIRGERYTKAAYWLEALASKRSAGVTDRSNQSENLGDLYLQIAEIYYDKLAITDKARASLRLAAEAFGPGMRSNAVYRQIASQALTEGCYDDAINAYESIGLEQISGHERLTAAKLYQRVARDYVAIELLQAANLAGTISDEGARLLFKLNRAQSRKREFALALEQGAHTAPVGIATTRLCEALRIYEDVLADANSIYRVQQMLHERNSDWLAHRASSVDELERAAQAAATDEQALASALLCRAIEVHTAKPASRDRPQVERSHALLAKLRAMVHAPNRTSASSQEYQALVRALLAVAAIENDQRLSSDLLCEVAKLRHTKLHDTLAATEAQRKALSIQPADAKILRNLDTMLREAGDFRQLANAYEMHLNAVTGSARPQPLIELGKLYQTTLGEPELARDLYQEAAAINPSVTEHVAELSQELSAPASAGFITDLEVSQELEKGMALESAGEDEEALIAYEKTAGHAPQDPRPFAALLRIYRQRGDITRVGRVLEQLTTLSNSPRERAGLFYERALLARDHHHDVVLAYEFLKEAAANDPENLRYAHALRTIAMARGEWALAAELTYREISSNPDPAEQGALYLELAFIYDEKLLDAAQALINYEQALALDPEIPAAPRPLARLYELAGRHEDAMQMYQTAAQCSQTKDERTVLLRHAAMNAERANQPARARELYTLVSEVMAPEIEEPAGDESATKDPIAHMEELLRSDAVKDEEERGQLLYALGKLYQDERDDVTAAYAAYEQALKFAPTLTKATDALADIAYQQRDWGRAHQLYNQVPTSMSELDPGTLTLRQAEISEALGIEDSAFEAYRSALEFAPRNTQVLAGVVRCALRVGQHADAFLAQQSLVELIPVDQIERLRNARIVLAELCEQMGDLDEALRCYEILLKEEPDSAIALSRMPSLYLECNRWSEGIDALRAQLRVTQAPDERAAVFYTLGEAYQHLNEDSELAIDSYFKAIDLDPDHVPTLRRLLLYYCDLGDFRSANEMARDLEKLGSLLETDTGLPLLHRAALAAAVTGNQRLCDTIGQSLGQGSESEVARALRQSFLISNPPKPEDLAQAGLSVCQVTGDLLANVVSLLESSDAGSKLQPLIAALKNV